MRPRLLAYGAVILCASFMLACSGGGGGGGSGILTPPTPPADLDLEPVASGLGTPVLVTAPSGDPRLFIVEKEGRIRIVKNGTLLPTAFWSCVGSVSTDFEQGLLGLAFDPGFASNHRFYVMLTTSDSKDQIWRCDASPSSDVATPGGTPIFTIDDPDPRHNGGMLAFGPDGMMYASLGDGGEEGDPNNRAQNKALVFGKILRLDVRSGSVATPSDNPYGNLVWSYGLRNPWRYSLDRVTGDMYIGDVGNEQYEEIDVALAPGRGRGTNFGWVVYEATHCFDPPNCTSSGLTPPVIEYAHTDACCVIGGYVYRGSKIAGLQGTYFYGDYCGHWVRSFYYSGGQATQQTEWPSLDTGQNVTSFGQDSAGELYLCTGQGNVYRIVPPPAVSSRTSVRTPFLAAVGPVGR